MVMLMMTGSGSGSCQTSVASCGIVDPRSCPSISCSGTSVVSSVFVTANMLITGVMLVALPRKVMYSILQKSNAPGFVGEMKPP